MGLEYVADNRLFHNVSKAHLSPKKKRFHMFPSEKLLHGNLNVSFIPISLIERSVCYRNESSREQRKQTRFTTRHSFKANLSRIRRRKKTRETEKKRNMDFRKRSIGEAKYLYRVSTGQGRPATSHETRRAREKRKRRRTSGHHHRVVLTDVATRREYKTREVVRCIIVCVRVCNDDCTVRGG